MKNMQRTCVKRWTKEGSLGAGGELGQGRAQTGRKEDLSKRKKDS